MQKVFSGELYFGSVTGYNKTDKLWSIQYDDGDFEEMECKDLNEAIKLYDNVMEHFSYGEDEITINYEESKIWGVKLYDKDNLLVNSTDTNIRDARVCHTTPFFRFTDRLHAAGTALFFEDDFDWSNLALIIKQYVIILISTPVSTYKLTSTIEI